MSQEAPKKSPYRAAIILVILVLLGVQGIKIYLDSKNETDGERKELMEKELVKIASEIQKQAKDPEKAKTLPILTKWFPQDLPCGLDVDLPQKGDPFWLNALKDKKKLRFSYRFQRKDQDFTIHARRDADCDGLHEIHQYKANLSWPDMLAAKHETQNPGE